MAGRAGEHKEMPHEMIVADPLVHKKDGARGIGYPSGEEPDHGLQRDGLHKGPICDQNQPAHAEIERE